MKWKFIAVAELFKLSTLTDGAEVYSHIQECDFAEAYIDLLHRKAERLRNPEPGKLLHLL